MEDEPLIAPDVQMLLEQQGLHVLGPVATVDKALRLLDQARPDVAILDLNLRGRGVTPVAERLRDLAIPFIIASADTSVVAGDAVCAQAEEVAKPIQLEHLLAALNRATDRKQKLFLPLLRRRNKYQRQYLPVRVRVRLANKETACRYLQMLTAAWPHCVALEPIPAR